MFPRIVSACRHYVPPVCIRRAAFERSAFSGNPVTKGKATTFQTRQFSCVAALRGFQPAFQQLKSRSVTFTKQVPPVLLRCIRQSASTAETKAASTIPPHAEKIVGGWLLTCAGMCFCAVVIGGITRLTESGLSMTQWHVIKGMKPPVTQEEWQAEFERYQQYPEYKYLERELDLEGFKKIFFWEYLHRMWGRTIGVVFALPAVYFLRKGWITRPMKPRLAIYFSLLVFQGLLGWYMVKSGLKEKDDPHEIPRVSQYRLAAHLSSAMVLYVLMMWSGLNHVLPAHKLSGKMNVAKLSKFAHGAMSLVFITAVSGAFVAGIDAGLTYNSWPKMADKWIPDDLFAKDPKWKNFFENPTMTQFNHRHIGELTGASIIGLWVFSRRFPLPPRARMAANALAAMAGVQVTLGVLTLLHYVPTWLAASHQGGALTLLGLAVWFVNELKRIPK